MNINEAAQALDGSEYGEEGSRELFSAMKDAGLVAVYGASDDLMEFNGAICDEIGCFDGGTAYLNSDGILENDCENDDCPHFLKAQDTAKTVEALWGAEPELSWTYETKIPHVTFTVFEGGAPYCRGIVFALKDAA